MSLIAGADSAVPQPDLYVGHRVWGVYVAGDTDHVWTKDEIAGTAAGGVEGVLPIYVPSQSDLWWLLGSNYLLHLIGAAGPLTFPYWCPAVLDIEEGQAEKMGPGRLAEVGSWWADICDGLNRLPWIYGSAFTCAQQPSPIRPWLAWWEQDAGVDAPPPPTLSPAYAGRQYAGDVEGGRIDRDVFQPGFRFGTPDLAGTVVIGPRARLARKTSGGAG